MADSSTIILGRKGSVCNQPVALQCVEQMTPHSIVAMERRQIIASGAEKSPWSAASSLRACHPASRTHRMSAYERVTQLLKHIRKCRPLESHRKCLTSTAACLMQSLFKPYVSSHLPPARWREVAYDAVNRTLVARAENAIDV